MDGDIVPHTLFSAAPIMLQEGEGERTRGKHLGTCHRCVQRIDSLEMQEKYCLLRGGVGMWAEVGR